MNPAPTIGVCEVHKYALNDARPIYAVLYCSLCNAYMCDTCRDSLFLRGIAAYNKAKATAQVRRVGL